MSMFLFQWVHKRRQSLPLSIHMNVCKFFSTTKLNLFIRGCLEMGRKSHQFCILFGIYLQFWLVICEWDFPIAPISIVGDYDLDYISIPIFAVGFIQKEIKLYKSKRNLIRNRNKNWDGSSLFSVACIRYSRPFFLLHYNNQDNEGSAAFPFFQIDFN